MPSDAVIELYIKSTAPNEGVEMSESALKDAVDALKELTPAQLNYLTKHNAEPT